MKLTIAMRLSIGFGLMLAIMFGLTIFGTNKVNQIDEKMTVINEQNSVKQRYAINFRGSVHDRAIAIRDVVLFEDHASVNKSLDEIKRLEDFYTNSAGPLDSLMASNSSNTEKDILSRIKAVERQTLPLVKSIVSLKGDGRFSEAKGMLLNDAKPAFEQWLAVINEFIDYQEEQNSAETEIVRETAKSFAGMMMTASIIAACIGIAIISLLVIHIKRQLGAEPCAIASVLGKMADGDLNFFVPEARAKSVMDSVARLKQQLSSTVIGLNTAADRIGETESSAEQSSVNLEKLESEQSASSDNAVSAMESLRDISNSISELVEQNKDIALKASEEATKGACEAKSVNSAMANISETVNLAVDKIKNLEQRTQQISGITNTISDISEQTNLLALNAAIEAARAGESGRGFAVVADEVRSLASRTGEATSEISTMLTEVYQETSQTMQIMEGSLPQIEKGMELSTNSSNILSSINARSSESQTIVSDVSSATQQQLNTIDKLNASMTSVIDKATLMTGVSKDLNGATESAANNLNDVGREIKKYADYFRAS